MAVYRGRSTSTLGRDLPVTLTLTYIDHGTLHNDVVLGFDGLRLVCDSYYFAMDPGRPGGSDAAKINAALRRLLEQWLEALQSLEDRRVIFLPYDFTDHYIRSVQCTSTDDGVAATLGRSLINGYAISASELGALLYEVPDFVSDGLSMTTTLNELTDSLRASILRSA